MNLSSRVGALAAAAVLTLTAAACGTDTTTAGAAGSTSAPSTAPSTPMSTPMAPAGTATATGGSSTVDTAHNDADVEFAQQMTVHHRGAVAMSELAPDRAASPEVKALAEKIKAAQAQEIELMTGWLQAWGVPASPESSGMGDMGGMDHGTTAAGGSMSMMPGMMTDAQMQQLTAASGAAFDTMFLQLMIEHHQGALEMSTTEKSSGQNADALALADSITSSQTTEIAEMKALLQGS